MDETRIIRYPERSELKDFIPLQTPIGKVTSPKDKFNERIANEQLKATKKGLPFAEVAVRADVIDEMEKYLKVWKRTGDNNKDWNPKIDWDKYSDLKNFEIIDTGKTYDKQSSKENRLPVFVKYKTYKYKGFSNTYTVMEQEEMAIQQALEALEGRNLKHLTKKELKVAT